MNNEPLAMNTNLPTITENEFLPPIHNWIKFGGLSIVAVVALAIPIASVAKYKVTVKAQAIVRPDGELRIVQAAASGQIKNIAVKNNRVVKKGDVIAQVDDSRLQMQKNQLQNKIQQGQQQIVQINAQIFALSSQIAAETDRNNRAVNSAKAQLTRIQREYQDKQVTTVTSLQEAEANLRSTQAALDGAKSKRDRYQGAAKAGALSKDQLEEVKVAVDQQEQAVEAAMVKVRQARAILNPSIAEVAIATERIAQEKAMGQSTLATLQREREALLQQRIESQKQQSQDRRELKQVETELQQTIITATADGTISKLNLRNTNQTVQPGEEIAQIAPSQNPSMVKVLVPSKEIGKIKQGQQAQLRISACPHTEYGTLKGKVKTIPPDAVTPQNDRTAVSANSISPSQNANAIGSFYEIAIAPESNSLGRGNDRCSLQLGMEGSADIITKEETVLQFFLKKAKLLTDI
jgi:HlyD family type I secretion membrane fusion protein